MKKQTHNPTSYGHGQACPQALGSSSKGHSSSCTYISSLSQPVDYSGAPLGSGALLKKITPIQYTNCLWPEGGPQNIREPMEMYGLGGAVADALTPALP